jgi:formamidopyrimidine-DNA glycosylase
VPEIAEVATFARELNTEYGRHSLYEVEFIGGRFLKPEFDQHQFISTNYPLLDVSIKSKGKFLYWSMVDADKANSIHFFFGLGMTGSFGKKQKHSAIRFEFDNGEVFFNDQRRFGSFRKLSGGYEVDLELKAKLDALGWDPLLDPNLPTDFVQKIRKHNHKRIGEFLLEQGPVICGIGNYLRSEVLYASEVSPLRLISSLTDMEIETIGHLAIAIIKKAYQAGGASIETYSDLYGMAGEFYKQFKVYGQKTDPDGRPVVKVKDKNGRMLHYVPEVQL